MYVTDVNYNFCAVHFTTHTDIKSLGCTPNTNVTCQLYLNKIFIYMRYIRYKSHVHVYPYLPPSLPPSKLSSGSLTKKPLHKNGKPG